MSASPCDPRLLSDVWDMSAEHPESESLSRGLLGSVGGGDCNRNKEYYPKELKSNFESLRIETR